MLTNKNIGLIYIKSGCLLFWSLWFFFVFLSNFFDFIYQYGLLSTEWAFRSDNYRLLGEVLMRYTSAKYLLNTLFTFDILLEFGTCTLFTAALVTYWRQSQPWLFINLAFGLSMALWAMFILIEEIFVTYIYIPAHMTLFILTAVSFLSMHLLPDCTKNY